MASYPESKLVQHLSLRGPMCLGNFKLAPDCRFIFVVIEDNFLNDLHG